MSERKAKLNKDGSPRKKPGPKPRKRTRAQLATLQASAEPSALDKCTAAYDAAPDPAAAAAAFRKAMPPMHTVPLTDWASLVAQAMARRALTGREASTMLYAAQVAATGRK